jgi:glutamate carboxypeptidase
VTPESRSTDPISIAARARAERDVQRLLVYAGHETPTGDAAALDGFARVLLEDAAALGASGQRFALPNGDAVLIEHPGRGSGRGLAPALVLAHHDTVHPVGSLAGAVPLRRDGELLLGPGVYDMKGGLVIALAALELLAELGLDHRPVRLAVTPDEEVGSPTSSALVVEQARGVAFALGLEPPHPDGALKTSRRGSTRVRLAVTGRAAHAAVDPGLGISATGELVDQLLAVRTLIAGYPDVLLNVGTLAGGGRTNVVAAHASADLGLRFVTLPTERDVLARLAVLEPVRRGAVVEVSVLSSRPAWGPAAPATDLLADVARAGASVGQSVTGRAADGAADTNLTGAAGVASLDGFGPLGGGAHAVTEHVVLASIPERVALLAAVLHHAGAGSA